ncbi:MAG TPA: DUF2085 domain-containing protein [Anaerolineae bacterium]|nr:DUF2085 domain-containing protein [Anaerolineae bacterium]
MIEPLPDRSPVTGLARSLTLWTNRRILWLANHWLAALNVFFLLYVGLPLLAPLLLAYGYTGAANTIYSLYRATCHQLPSRSYFIAGEQVAICHRDVAIYSAFLLGGLGYNLVRGRLKPPQLRWYVFFLWPIALDAGMQLASDWLRSGVSMGMLWAIGLIAMGLTSAILHSQKYLTWHSYLYFLAGPLALIYLKYFGPYQSDLFRRTISGIIFGLTSVWLAYPYLEDAFADMRREVSAKLAKASGIDTPVGRG